MADAVNHQLFELEMVGDQKIEVSRHLRLNCEITT